MAQFDFPSSPSTNQTYTSNGVTFKWDGVAWRRITSTGAQGDTGAQGAQGAGGTNGTNGTNGAQGAQGAQGHQGNNGAQGDDGNSVTGAQGDVGAQGAQGAQGASGGGGGAGSFVSLSDTPNSLTAGKYLRVNYAGSVLGYVDSGAGPGFVNVADFGLDASATDGTNVTAINNAIAELGDHGGTLFFPGGQFYLNNDITIDRSNLTRGISSLRFVGSGHGNFGGNPAQNKSANQYGDIGGTVLRRDQNNGEFFNCTNVRAIHFVGITFKGGASTNTNGTGGINGGSGAITVTADAGCQGYLFENLVFHGIKNCLNLNGLSDSIIRGCRFRLPPKDEGTGAFITLDDNGDERSDQIRISDCIGDGWVGVGSAFQDQVDGIHIKGHVNTIFITNTSMIRCHRGYYTHSSWVGEFLYFQNAEAERAGHDGFRFEAGITTNRGDGNFITLDNCFSSTNLNNGITLAGSLGNDGGSVNITNCNVRGNEKHGILVDSDGGNTSIVNPICADNNQSGSGAHGITIGSGIDDVYIAGGRCGGGSNLTGSSAKQSYGIRIDGSSHDNIRIIGTNCTGNATGGIDASFSGSGNKIQFNSGSTLSVNTN